MKRLEDELRTLLQRKQPPEALAGRVLDQIESGASTASFRPRGSPRRKPWAGWIAAIAACVILTVGLAWLHRVRREHAEANLASKQATVALRVASSEFNGALELARQATEHSLGATSK